MQQMFNVHQPRREASHITTVSHGERHSRDVSAQGANVIKCFSEELTPASGSSVSGVSWRITCSGTFTNSSLNLAI